MGIGRGSWSRLRQHVLSPTWWSLGILVAAEGWIALRVLVLAFEPPGSAGAWSWAILLFSLAAGYSFVGVFLTDRLVRERSRRPPSWERRKSEAGMEVGPTVLALVVIAIYLSSR